MALKFKATPKYFEQVSEGDLVGGGLVLHPAPYLPIIYYNDFDREAVVIKGGTILAMDEYGFVVPANGGIATNTFTYTQMDVDHGVMDYDTFDGTVSSATVSAPKTTTKTMADNVPIGIAPYDVYMWDMNKDPFYKVQQSVGLLEDYLILVPITSDLQTTYGVGTALGQYHAGALVTSDAHGNFVPFVAKTDDIAATGSAYNITNLEQQVGRIIKIQDLAKEPQATGGYELVNTVPGLGLGGRENGGVPTGIDPTTKLGAYIQLLF